MENTFSELVESMTGKGVDIFDYLDYVGEVTNFGESGGEDFTHTLKFFEEAGMTRQDALALIDEIHKATGYVSDFEFCINLDSYLSEEEDDFED